jgi:hypothetical protein
MFDCRVFVIRLVCLFHLEMLSGLLRIENESSFHKKLVNQTITLCLTNIFFVVYVYLCMLST